MLRMGLSAGAEKASWMFPCSHIDVGLIPFLVCVWNIQRKKIDVSVTRKAFVISTLELTLVQTVWAINWDDDIWGNHVCKPPLTHTHTPSPIHVPFPFSILPVCFLLFVLLINSQWRSHRRIYRSKTVTPQCKLNYWVHGEERQLACSWR